MTVALPTPTSLPTVQKAGFKRLRMKHRRIIALHLSGESNGDIATTLGVQPYYISQVLNDPLAKQILESAYADFEMETRALLPGAIDAVRRNLKDADGKVALQAAGMAFKVNGKFENQEEKRETAEDVIERILEAVGTDGTRIRYTDRRFIKQSMSQIGTDQGSTDD